MGIEVSRVLHSGYVFKSGKTNIIFDPIFENPFSVNCYAYPDVEFDLNRIRSLRFDAVFISHEHDDHFSFKSLDLIDRGTPVYMFSAHEEIFELIKALGFQTVIPIELNSKLQVGAFEITAYEALEAHVDSIYRITAGESHILHVVDSWIGPETLKKLCTFDWNLILWPFQTLRELEAISPAAYPPASDADRLIPEEWAQQLTELKPRAVVAGACQFRFEDWSWYNDLFFPISYEGFKKQLAEILPNTQVIKLNPGRSLRLQNKQIEPGPELEWVKPRGPQELDYYYRPETVIPTYAEVAKRFQALNEDQKKKRIDFCKRGLAQRFLKLSPPDQPVQAWRLGVYDHLGTCTHYDYVFNGRTYELRPSQNSNVWLTEISEAKLYAALYEGESLTSIYMRITPNSKEIDLFEDPLLRVLYEGRIGHYQKAQLAELKNERPSF